jgi:hypothetical protein
MNTDMTLEDIKDRISRNEAQLARAKADLATLQAGGRVGHLTLENAHQNVEGIEMCVLHLRKLRNNELRAQGLLSCCLPR